MRVCYFLLLATATLIANSKATTTSGQTQLSKVASADTVQTGGDRFLRSHHLIEEDDAVADYRGSEERAKPLFDTGRLTAALSNNKKMARLFKRWEANGYTANAAANKIGVDVNGAMDQTFAKLYMSYNAYLKGYRPN